MIATVSVRADTMGTTPRRSPRTEPLRSHTGVSLTRAVTFKFALDPNQEQRALFAFNHHLARIKANLDQREAERSYSVPTEDLAPSGWDAFSLERNPFRLPLPRPRCSP